MSETDSTHPLAPWRTVLTVAFICTLQAAGFLYGTHHGWTIEGASAFGSLCLWSTVGGAAVAGKALGEHLSNGSGWKGAISALLTSTKPGDPPPEPTK